MYPGAQSLRLLNVLLALSSITFHVYSFTLPPQALRPLVQQPCPEYLVQQKERQSSDNNDPSQSTTVSIAFIDTRMNFEGEENLNDRYYFNDIACQLETHSFSRMTGVKLVLFNIPTTPDAGSSWSIDHLSLLQRSDIICFSDSVDVQTYLCNLDNYLGVPLDMKEEDKKKLPNRPVDDMSTVMVVACPNFNTARECLQSGRWTSNHIYYPKNEKKMNGDDDYGEIVKVEIIDLEQ